MIFTITILLVVIQNISIRSIVSISTTITGCDYCCCYHPACLHCCRDYCFVILIGNVTVVIIVVVFLSSYCVFNVSAVIVVAMLLMLLSFVVSCLLFSLLLCLF